MYFSFEFEIFDKISLTTIETVMKLGKLKTS